MKITKHQSFSLRAVVQELIACHARSGNSSLQIINNISSELILDKHIDPLAPLIGDLLSILSNTQNKRIVFISALKVNGSYKLYSPSQPSPVHPETHNHFVNDYNFIAN